MSSLLRLVLVILLAGLLSACDAASDSRERVRLTPEVYSVSVSSDGRHALSVHADRRVILWDLENRAKTVVSTNGNLFSAYFVKGVPYYMWQDLDGLVHVRDLGGREVQSFKVPPVYGHVLSSDLRIYIYSDARWGLYRRWPDGRIEQWKAPGGRTYRGSGKILNILFSPDEKFLLQAGAGYEFDTKYALSTYAEEGWKELVTVAIWDVASGKPEAVFPGNIAKTHATFSPDGKYVVSGDENGRVYVWNAQEGQRLFDLASLWRGVLVDKSGGYGKYIWDKTGLIEQPPDFEGDAAIVIKFINHDNHYLRFTTYQHYAILYSIDSPLPLKYLDLGTKPFPATRDYSRNTAIDTAPAAGILVTGQAAGPGINVYKYDKATQTLKRIWVAR